MTLDINISKFFPKDYKIEAIGETYNSFHMKIISKSKNSCCPCCGKESTKVHSKYIRKFSDLPIINKSLYITFVSKKFFCKNLDCKRKIFTERYKNFINVYARTSIRLDSAIKNIIFTNSAETASKILNSVITCISPSTILRIVRGHSFEIKRSITEGTNAKNIYHLIKENGFEGSYSSVRKKIHDLKNSTLFKNINTGKLKIDKQNILKLLCKSTSNLTTKQVGLLKRLKESNATLAELKRFIDNFYLIFKEKSLSSLYAWINEAIESKFKMLKSFAKGLLKDIDAVNNAVIYSYSNGVLEGNINRLKMIKRQMYGRAKFDLIRQKILYRI